MATKHSGNPENKCLHPAGLARPVFKMGNRGKDLILVCAGPKHIKGCTTEEKVEQ